MLLFSISMVKRIDVDDWLGVAEDVNSNPVQDGESIVYISLSHHRLARTLFFKYLHAKINNNRGYKTLRGCVVSFVNLSVALEVRRY